MGAKIDPAIYEAWYHTPRGRWIADREYELIQKMLDPQPGSSVLDVGSGTGHFSRRFVQDGHPVIAVDPDLSMLGYAARQSVPVTQVRGSALALPFADQSVDYAVAITSLCFIDDPALAVQEMWRVCRSGMVLGLLNRKSLLYLLKKGHGGYRGARWDTNEDVMAWCSPLEGRKQIELQSAILFPGGGAISRWFEQGTSNDCLYGGFMACVVKKAEEKAD